MASKPTVSRAEFVAVTARLALVEERLAELDGAKKAVKARAPAAGHEITPWAAVSGEVIAAVQALVGKGGDYHEDARWDDCKRSGFPMRIAGYLKANGALDDGEGGYTVPDEGDLVEAVEFILDNPEYRSATAEARGGMSLKQLKEAGVKPAKPTSKPVAPAKKPVAPAKSVLKKKVAAPAAESESEEEAPAPPPKKAVKPVAAAAAAVAAAEEPPTAEELAEESLKKVKVGKTEYLKHTDTKEMYASWADFKAGTCAGIWGMGADSKMGIQPKPSGSNAAAAAAGAGAEEQEQEA